MATEVLCVAENGFGLAGSAYETAGYLDWDRVFGSEAEGREAVEEWRREWARDNDEPTLVLLVWEAKAEGRLGAVCEESETAWGLVRATLG